MCPCRCIQHTFLDISLPLKESSEVCLVPCKLLPKHLWRSLFFVKFHTFSIFLCTPLDGCFLNNMKVIFERHLILDIQPISRRQKPHCKNIRWKYIKNESRNSRTKSNVSRFFLIGHACWFCPTVVCVPDRVWWSKFDQVWSVLLYLSNGNCYSGFKEVWRHLDFSGTYHLKKCHHKWPSGTNWCIQKKKFLHVCPFTFM